jgi:hypothetical protein
MKVYITKYALTAGIMEVEAKGTVQEDMVLYRPADACYDQYAHNGEWCKDIDSAKAKAEQMRIAKIASLKKQIAKLEKLEF